MRTAGYLLLAVSVAALQVPWFACRSDCQEALLPLWALDGHSCHTTHVDVSHVSGGHGGNCHGGSGHRHSSAFEVPDGHGPSQVPGGHGSSDHQEIVISVSRTPAAPPPLPAPTTGDLGAEAPDLPRSAPAAAHPAPPGPPGTSLARLATVRLLV